MKKGDTGFEPVTYWSAVNCSSTELIPLMIASKLYTFGIFSHEKIIFYVKVLDVIFEESAPHKVCDIGPEISNEWGHQEQIHW